MTIHPQRFHQLDKKEKNFTLSVTRRTTPYIRIIMYNKLIYFSTLISMCIKQEPDFNCEYFFIGCKKNLHV